MTSYTFIGKARITRQGQLTLPIRGRENLNISVGDDLYWYQLNDSLVVTKELVSPKELAKLLRKR